MADLIGLYRSSNGTWKEYLQIPSGSAYDNLGFRIGPVGFTGSLDNLSVKKVSQLTLTPGGPPPLVISAAVSATRSGVLSPQLVVNGTFDTGIVSWAANSSTLGNPSGTIRVISDGNGVVEPSAYQAVTTIIGHTYKLVVDVIGGSVTFGAIAVGNTISGVTLAALGGNGAGKTITFVATAATTYVRLYISSAYGAGEYCDFDNVSLVDLGADVVLGHTLILNAAASITQADAVVLSVPSVFADSAVSLSQADNLTLAPETALILADGASASQVDSLLLVSRYGLVPGNANSFAVVDSLLLTLRSLTGISATSFTLTTSPVLFGYRLFFFKIGFDANTHKSLAADPGTVIYKGNKCTELVVSM